MQAAASVIKAAVSRNAEKPFEAAASLPAALSPQQQLLHKPQLLQQSLARAQHLPQELQVPAVHAAVQAYGTPSNAAAVQAALVEQGLVQHAGGHTASHAMPLPQPQVEQPAPASALGVPLVFGTWTTAQAGTQQQVAWMRADHIVLPPASRPAAASSPRRSAAAPQSNLPSQFDFAAASAHAAALQKKRSAAATQHSTLPIQYGVAAAAASITASPGTASAHRYVAGMQPHAASSARLHVAQGQQSHRLAAYAAPAPSDAEVQVCSHACNQSNAHLFASPMPTVFAIHGA